MKSPAVLLLSYGLLRPDVPAALAFASPLPIRLTVARVGVPSGVATAPLSFARQTNTNTNTNTNSNTGLNLFSLRGGGAAIDAASSTLAPLASKVSDLASTPAGTFRLLLGALAAMTLLLRTADKVNDVAASSDDSKAKKEKKDPALVSLQRRFLAVFWLLRCADWLQGPYFYEVYASKMFGGAPASMAWISRLFLTGFASTALFGPLAGRLCDARGRKLGTLAFCGLYALGAGSVRSSALGVLLLGRVMGGIGTSLLFSAPEAWLVGEANKEGLGAKLGETFGLAYAGDSIVAILAGQMAGAAASIRGPTGPFELSLGFLSLGAILAAVLWKENVAGGGVSAAVGGSDDGDGNEVVDKKPTIRDAVKVIKSDPKIMLVGSVQSFFEAAMYVFVLNWPPAVAGAISAHFGTGAATPYGGVFSCFMAACLLGSTVFGRSTRAKPGGADGMSAETFAGRMLILAALSMGGATVAASGLLPPFLSSPGRTLAVLVGCLFAFESTVGMYFPAVGTLRSRYVPDSHRSVIMNLFGIPLNLMVVTVFLSIKRLGTKGALGVSTASLALAAGCMWKLKAVIAAEKGGEMETVVGA